ncbi:MAG: GNAT family protein, partial [Gemmatimonadota bacterium]
HARGELGYWIGRPHWGNGYVTEAAAAVIRHGFMTLDLNRIEAHHLSGNDASGRVLLKVGMTHEGSMREHVRKWGKFQDVEGYSILRREYRPQQ